MANFASAIETVLSHEGGYSNDPADPGGQTRYGISKLQYPDLDIAGLTKEQAMTIYYEDFWVPYGYDRIINNALATKIFDLAVNVGPHQAHILVQRALKACGYDTLVEDGILGSITLSALNATPHALYPLRAEQANYYRTLSSTKPQLTKLNGWLKRAYT